MADPLLIERRGSTSYLTLNRPDAGNAINLALARSLEAAVAAADDDPQTRCVVLRGAGRMFCVGGDISALYAAGEALPDLLEEILRHLHPAVLRLASMRKPVISAIQGPCAGAGIGLAAVGDIVLAETAAHFTMAYSAVGLSPDAGATWFLPRLVGYRRAQELSYTNRRISAETAAEMGLVTRVVAQDALGAEVESCAAHFEAGPSDAFGRTKSLFFTAAGASLARQLDAERDAIVLQARAREGRTGVAAFAERRKPIFSVLK